MIGIKVGNEFLVLPTDAELKLVLKSPLFVYDSQPASRIESFTIDAEPNEHIILYANKIDNRNRILSFDCELFLFGIPYKLGKLDILRSSEQKYECQVRIDKSYYGDFATKNIRSFNYLKDNTGWRFWYKNCEHWQFFFDPANVPHPNYSITISLTYQGVVYPYIIPYIDGLDNNSSLFPDDRTHFLDRIISTINSDHETHKFFAQRVGNDQLIIGFAGGYVNPLITYSGSNTDITFVVETWLYNSGTYHPNVAVEDVFREVQNNPADYDHCFFPIIDKNFFGKTLAELRPDITFYPGSEVKYLNADFPVHYLKGGTFNIYYETSATPFVYLHEIIKLINAEIGVEIVDHFFDEELKKLIIYNTIDVAERFVKTSGSSAIFTTRKFKVSEALPSKTLADFYNGIGAQFCTVFDFDTSRKRIRIESRKNILANPKYTDWSNKIIKGVVLDSETFKPNLRYVFDSNDSAISDRIKPRLKYQEKDPVFTYLSFSALAKSASNIDDYRLLLCSNHYYGVEKVFAVSPPDKWSFLSENLYDYIFSYEENYESIDITSNTTCQELDILGKANPSGAITNDYFHLLIPIVNQIGRSNRENALQDEHGLRLLFYRGLKAIYYGFETPGNLDSASAYQYAWGTYNNKFIDGSTDGDYTLNLNGEKGLYETWWKDWIAFISNSPPCELPATLDLTDILNFDTLEKKRIDNINYLIDEITIPISKQIGIASIKAYPIKSSFNG